MAGEPGQGPTATQVTISNMPQDRTISLSFGTIHCGLELMRDAWPNWTHVFSVSGMGRATHQYPGRRPPRKILRKHPVDLLVVDCGSSSRPPPTSHEVCAPWKILLTGTPRPPMWILESWPPHSTLWENGPCSKGTRCAWEAIGYTTHGKFADTSKIGGPSTQQRLVVVRRHRTAPPLAIPPDWTGCYRPAANCITPPGLTPRRAFRHPPLGVTPTDPSVGPLPFPAPREPNPWIHTDKGPRQVLPEELAKSIGASDVPEHPQPFLS